MGRLCTEEVFSRFIACGEDVEREISIAMIRSWIAEQIEIVDISDDESEKLPLYFKGNRQDIYVFHVSSPLELPHIGAGYYVAVSKENGSIVYAGHAGD